MEDFVEAEEGLVVVEVEVAIARATANCLYHLLWSMKFVSKYFILALCITIGDSSINISVTSCVGGR